MEVYQIRLREIRNDNDLTQDDVAKILGTTQQQYGKYELGKQDMNINHLKTLCSYYKISADYILGLPKDLNWPR